MNKKFLAGFREITSGKDLIEKTKRKLSAETSDTPHHSSHSLFSKRPRRLALAALPAVAVILIVSLLLPGPFSDRQTANAQDLMAGVKSRNVDTSGAVTDAFLRSTQNFSIELFKSSAGNGENTLISPASVYLALGMTANGAGGDTLKAFESVLGQYNLSLNDLNKGYKAYADQLSEKKGHTSLSLANSIWYRTGFSANPPFLQANADYFGAAAQSLDFDDSSAVKTINSWVKKNTNGKIDSILDKIPSDAVMYLINALYFDARWQTSFEKATEGGFNLEDGSTSKALFMSLNTPVDYMKGDNESAILLPYDDGRFAFLAILPNEGIKLADYIQTLNDQTISQLLDKKESTGMSVLLPKFKASGDYVLNDTLQAMGLETAFDPNQADFTNMGSKKNNLYISLVRHKTFLQIDELGTQAGAATSVEMREVSAPLNLLNFNRPFVYAVIDTQTGLPLFIGAMENPQNP